MDDLIAKAREQRQAAHDQTHDRAKDIQGLQKHDEMREAIKDAHTSLSRTIMAHKPVVTVANPVTSVATPDVRKVVEAVKHLETALKPAETDLSEVVSRLSEVVTAVQGIAREIVIPEARESVQVSNWDEIRPLFEEMLLSLKTASERKPDTITVSAPEVVVNEKDIDLGPVKTALEQLLSATRDNKPAPTPEVDLSPVVVATEATTAAVAAIRFPTPGITPTDPLIRYAPADIDDAGDVQYFGYIDMTGKWYIQRMDNAASPKTLRYATGNTDYPTGWTGRAGLTYDYLYEVFG